MTEVDGKLESKKHLPALDGIRGLAIAVVLASHFGAVMSPDRMFENSIRRVAHFGGLGVDLFFVLSGFLITGILLDSVKSRSYFSTFYIRRMLRIFPLYYAFLLFVYTVGLRGLDPMPAGKWPWYFFYVCNWTPSRGLHPLRAAHLWSLAIEEQFYIVWPLVVFLIPRRWLGYFCGIGILGVLCLRQVMIHHGASSDTMYRLTPVRMDTLLMGAILALIYRNAAWLRTCARFAIPVGLLTAAVFLIIEACRSRVAANAGPDSTPVPTVMMGLNQSLPGVAFACLILWVLTAGSRSVFFNAKFMKSLGRYSYGIYVLHPLAWGIILMHRSAASGDAMDQFHGMSFVTKFGYIVLLYVISFGLAWVSWNVLEQPFLKLKRRFPYLPAREPAVGVPAAAVVGLE